MADKTVNEKAIEAMIHQALDRLDDGDLMHWLHSNSKLAIAIEIRRGEVSVHKKARYVIKRLRGTELSSGIPLTPQDWTKILALAELSREEFFSRKMREWVERLKAEGRVLQGRGQMTPAVNEILGAHRLPYRIIGVRHEDDGVNRRGRYSQFVKTL